MADGFQDFQRQMPSVDRKVSEIKQDDVRVAIIGTVLDAQGNRLAIDDGTGNVNVSFEEDVSTEPGKMVRVLGRVMPMEGGVEIQGDALQDMSGLDMELKKKVDELAGTGKQ
ncbi:MAG: replication protein RepA [Candidatus Aenigmatarchaeota archaeon]|nr:MAG: replication protein RepA [Candidatus Aenigmarchaeota archaeon]